MLLTLVTSAQQISVTDNKGTFKIVNNNQVTTAATAPTSPLVGDIWFDTSVSPNVANIWDGTSWIAISNAGNFWALTGNSGIDDSVNFLGTTDAEALILKSNNTEKLQLHPTKGQVLINQAPTFNNHPLVIRANGNDVLAFQNNAGTPKWHWNLLSGGLNFVESNVADYRLFLENGGNVGVNTNDPTERLDVNGKLRVRDIQTNAADQDILTTTATGVVEKKPLLAAETDNKIELGANGGVYLGPIVYTGSFIINAPGGNFATTFNQTISGLPFQPSQITFVAHANIESNNIDSDNGVGNNDAWINNAFGTMNGFVRSDGATNTQQVIYVGGHGNSINDISRYASSANCIGIRYGSQNGDDLGKITASLNTFNTDGFTLSISYSLGTLGNTPRRREVLSESLVVLYTAYK